MKVFRRCQRILILSLLFLSVLAPMILVSHRLKTFTSIGEKEFVEDISSRRRRDVEVLKSIKQEVGEGLKEPKPVVFKQKDFRSRDRFNSLKFGSNRNNQNEDKQFEDGEKGKSMKTKGRLDNNMHSQSWGVRDALIKEIESQHYNLSSVKHDKNMHNTTQSRSIDYKVKEIKDQLIRAKAYLSLAPPGSNCHMVKELRQRIKELERAVGEATTDSVLTRSVLQKMRNMESTLLKTSHAFPDCSAMTSKLRAMTDNAEEQVRMQKIQATYLLHLAARTTPKGFHCLSMRLTSEYFAIEPPERHLPKQQKLHGNELYHYAIFSDNVLACAVVVNSTISNALEPAKIFFHLVTNALNFPSMSMWFLLNPPGKATVEVLSIEDFEWLSKDYDLEWKKQSSDPRFISELNYLRFYLPNVFPSLDKVVLLDHDVVVQKDLTDLWHVDMEGKVNSAVETCQESEISFLRMDMFINFSDPLIAKKFSDNACTWAFGMNLFDLRKWRKENLSALCREYMRLSNEKPILKGGSLPLGWMTFYNRTKALDRRWHVLGLGHDSTVERDYIEQAAVIHYDGVRKPWLDIAFGRYKEFWSKYIDYNIPYLQQCNIHG